MVETVWTLLVVFVVQGDGAGSIHTERFEPYTYRATCEAAAKELTQPVFAEEGAAVVAKAYCLPGSGS